MKPAKTLDEAAAVLKNCVGFKESVEKHDNPEDFAAAFLDSPGAGVKIWLTQFGLGNISPLWRWFESQGVTEPRDMVFHVLHRAWKNHNEQA